MSVCGSGSDLASHALKQNYVWFPVLQIKIQSQRQATEWCVRLSWNRWDKNDWKWSLCTDFYSKVYKNNAKCEKKQDIVVCVCHITWMVQKVCPQNITSLRTIFCFENAVLNYFALPCLKSSLMHVDYYKQASLQRPKRIKRFLTIRTVTYQLQVQIRKLVWKTQVVIYWTLNEFSKTWQIAKLRFWKLIKRVAKNVQYSNKLQ